MDVSADQPIFVISVAAELADMHPQTLRQYDRLGIVSPSRAPGKSRRYSQRDINMLREVQRLSQEGVSLEGIKRILELENLLPAPPARIIPHFTDRLGRFRNPFGSTGRGFLPFLFAEHQLDPRTLERFGGEQILRFRISREPGDARKRDHTHQPERTSRTTHDSAPRVGCSFGNTRCIEALRCTKRISTSSNLPTEVGRLRASIARRAGPAGAGFITVS